MSLITKNYLIITSRTGSSDFLLRDKRTCWLRMINNSISLLMCIIKVMKKEPNMRKTSSKIILCLNIGILMIMILYLENSMMKIKKRSTNRRENKKRLSMVRIVIKNYHLLMYTDNHISLTLPNHYQNPFKPLMSIE